MFNCCQVYSNTNLVTSVKDAKIINSARIQSGIQKYVGEKYTIGLKS